MAEIGNSAAIGSLVMNLSINDANFTKSLKNINRDLRANRQMWQANAESLKTANDLLGSHQAKLEGLQDNEKSLIEVQKRLKKARDDANDSLDPNIYNEASRQLAKYEKQLKSVQAQIAREKNAVAKLDTGVDDMQKQVTAQKSLNRAVKEGTASSKGYYSAEKESIQGVVQQQKKLNELYQAQSRYVKHVGNNSGTDSSEYTTEVAKLKQVQNELNATTRASEKLRAQFAKATPDKLFKLDSLHRFNKGLEGGTSKLGQIHKGLKAAEGAATATTAAMTVGLGYSLKKATELQHTFIVTKNLLNTAAKSDSRITNKQAEYVQNAKLVNKMQNDGAKFSIKYGKSQTDIAKGYQELVKRGYSASQALGAMNSMMAASTASGDEFNNVTNVSAQVLEAFGMRAKETDSIQKQNQTMSQNTTKVVNSLAYAADMTATDFQSMGKAMEYVSVSSHKAGFSLDETASAIGILSNNGLEADKAGTGLRKAISSLTSPTKAADAQLKSLGLSAKSFYDQSGNMKSMSQIFGMIQDRLEKSGKKSGEKADFFHTVFGATGQQAAQILSEQNKQLGELTGKVSKAAKNNYVQNLADKNMKSAENQLKRLQQAGLAIATTLGTAILPGVVKIAEKLASAADWFQNLSKGTKNFTAYVLVGVTAASALLVVASKVVGAIKVMGSLSETLLKWQIKGSAAQLTDIANIDKSTVALERKIKAQEAYNVSAKAGAEIDAADTISSSSTKTVTGTGRNSAGKVLQGAASTGRVKPYSTIASATSATKSAGIISKSIGALGGKLNAGLTLLTVGATLWKATKDYQKTASSKEHAKILGKTIGDTSGTVAGTVLGTALGGPLGSMIGGAIGKSAGSFLGGSVAKAFNNSKTTASNNKDRASGKQNNAGAYATTMQQNGLQVDKKTLAKLKEQDKIYNLQAKSLRTMRSLTGKAFNITVSTKGLLSANVEVKKSNKLFNQYSKNIQSNYKAMAKQVNSYAKSQQKSSQKNINFLKQEGLISDKTAKSINARSKKRYNDAAKDFDKYVTKSLADEKAYAAAKKKLQKDGSVKYMGKVYSSLKSLNNRYQKQIASQTKKGGEAVHDLMGAAGDKQKILIGKLNNSKHKLDNSYLMRKIKEARSNTNKIINNAKKERDKSVDAAQDKYKKVMKAADEEYYAKHTISKKQYEDIKDKAQKTRKTAIDNANAQKKGVVNSANAQYKNVVSAAKNQSKDHLSANSAELSGVSKNYNGFMGGLMKVIDWFGGIFSAITKFFGGKKPGKSFSVKKAPVVQQKYAGFDRGGKITKDQHALVGEAGAELAYNPTTHSSRLLGANGAEVTKVKAGEHILNATDTAKVLGGGLGGTLNGYDKGTSSLTDFLGDAWDKAKSTVSGVIKWTQDKVSDTVDKLNPAKKFLKAGNTGEIGKALADGTNSLIKKAIEKMQDMVGGGSGSGSAFIAKAKELGEGKPYVWGAAGPDSYDCSGLVAAALKTFGISYPHYTQSQYEKSEKISKKDAKPGDLIFWGPNGHGHVGIYADETRMYDASSPSSHPQIGYHPWNVRMHGTGPMFARVPGLAKAGGLGNSGGGTVPNAKHRQMLDEADIPSSWFNGMNWLINKESSWNYKATNASTGAYGLGQALPPSQMADFGSDWRTNPMTQLKWMKHYVSNRYGNPSNAVAFHKRKGWYSQGGMINSETQATLGENNRPEMVIPLKDTDRAVELIARALPVLSAKGTAKANNTAGSTGADTDMSEKLDKMIELLQAVVSNQANPIPAVVQTAQAYTEISKYKNAKTQASIIARGK